MSDIEKLFSCQSTFVIYNKYEDEFQTMQLLFNLNQRQEELFRGTTLKFFDNLIEKSRQNKSRDELIRESKAYREEGNELFTAQGDRRDVLGACKLYTKSIFTAPKKSEELPFAFANRAMALQEYGFYQQAYDDCECALEYGYPERLMHKLVTRQAFCALKLGDTIRGQLHLDALGEMELNANFQKHFQEMKLKLESLQEKKNLFNETGLHDNINLSREGQCIVNSFSQRGRFMIASKDIKENEIIFSEKAPSFVPVADWLICQQCAATLLVPIPCVECFSQVVYCSQKCRKEHAKTHQYECPAYQYQLFNHIGISHLAFRMVLDGFTEAMPLLFHKRNAEEIWSELVNERESIRHLDYAETFRMQHHFDKMTVQDVLWFGLVSKLLTFYLMEYTQFFESLGDSSAPLKEWAFVTGALIFRHIGQLISNGHSCISIVPYPFRTRQLWDFTLFTSHLWVKPYHLRKGLLHRFSSYDEIAAANFPYLSICNHSCEQSFQPKFSGRYVTTFAAKHLRNGEEITNCYTLDYRKSKYTTRQNNLQSTYHFICDCDRCMKEFPDEDYETFHTYRCENPECKDSFVPRLPTLTTLDWWDATEGFKRDENICCTRCNTVQKCIWYDNFVELLNHTKNPAHRATLFDKFDELSQWLLDYHEIKLVLANKLISNCFKSHNEGYFLLDEEFSKIILILKFLMDGIAVQSRVNSVEYVVKMTYLWDIMALGKYKPSSKEMNEMLQSLNIVSEEIKIIFNNYYDDYIKSQIM